MTRKAAALRAVETELEPVETWDGVDDRMLEIGRKDLEIQALEAQLQERILLAAADLSPKIKRLQEDRIALAGGVIEFATEHRADVEGKSWRGAFGKLTWPNESSTVVLVLTEATVINKLKGLDLDHCIRSIEQVDKDAVKALAAATLKRIGVKIETKNVAGAEEDPPKLSIDKKKVQKHDNPSPTTGGARKRARG